MCSKTLRTTSYFLFFLTFLFIPSSSCTPVNASPDGGSSPINSDCICTDCGDKCCTRCNVNVINLLASCLDPQNTDKSNCPLYSKEISVDCTQAIDTGYKFNQLRWGVLLDVDLKSVQSIIIQRLEFIQTGLPFPVMINPSRQETGIFIRKTDNKVFFPCGDFDKAGDLKYLLRFTLRRTSF